MHACFDRYVNSNTMLNKFVVQYDKVVHAWREVEEREDFQTMNMQGTLSPHPIEKVVGKWYTQWVFRKFQVEFIASNNCTHKNFEKRWLQWVVSSWTYWRGSGKTEVVHYTAYDRVLVLSSCALFETLGILCQHMLYRWSYELPEHYILRRWTLSVRCVVGHTGAGTSQTRATEGGPTHLELWILRSKLDKV